MSNIQNLAALILAAGRGQRMRPLTDTCPKPLLTVHGQPLLQWWLDKLGHADATPIIINTGWLGEQIETHFAHADNVLFSSEARDFGHALETAGGIARALPLLAPRPDDAFWVVAGDIFAPDFVFDVAAAQRFAASNQLAHLWLVPNPPHHPQGDFALHADGTLSDTAAAEHLPGHTFSTIGLYRRQLFEPPWCNIPAGNPTGVVAPLAPLLRHAMASGQVTGELYRGRWVDVGTPERLAQINASS